MCGLAATICRVASTPFSPGIPRSIRTTSGWARAAAATASAPSRASPTTSIPGTEDSSERIPVRNASWSSATRTRSVSSLMLPRGRAAGPGRAFRRWTSTPG